MTDRVSEIRARLQSNYALPAKDEDYVATEGENEALDALDAATSDVATLLSLFNAQPQGGPRGDARFTPPAEDALHVAICQAVQEHYGPTANAVLRTALSDYKPTQLTRTELVRIQQRSGSEDVTAVMVSLAATSSPTPAESVDVYAVVVYREEAAKMAFDAIQSALQDDWAKHYSVLQIAGMVASNIRRISPAAPAESTRVAGEQVTRFKVGDRLRNIRASYLPIATVTTITERGFKYELDRPFVISPRLGTQTGGESYDDSQWEIAASDSARRAAEEIYDQLTWYADDNTIQTMTAIITKHFTATEPVLMAGRVVNVSSHGEPTRARLREIEASVSNGYESECRELGWSRALQATLRDLHFLLTFFRDDLTNTSVPADNDTNAARSTLARQLIEAVQSVVYGAQFHAADFMGRDRRQNAYLDGANDALSALRAKCEELGVGVGVGDGYECDGINCPPRAHDHKVLL